MKRSFANLFLYLATSGARSLPSGRRGRGARVMFMLF